MYADTCAAVSWVTDCRASREGVAGAAETNVMARCVKTDKRGTIMTFVELGYGSWLLEDMTPYLLPFIQLVCTFLALSDGEE